MDSRITPDDLRMLRLERMGISRLKVRDPSRITGSFLLNRPREQTDVSDMDLAYKLRIRLGILGFLAWFMVAPTATAQNETPLGVAPALADSRFRAIDAGLSFWIQGALAESGFETMPLARAATRDQLLALAAQQGLQRTLVARIRQTADNVTVQFLLFAPDSRALLAGSLATGPVADLGISAATAAESMLAQLGAPDHDVTPPLIDDLSSMTRSLNAWSEGDLLTAWRAVQGKLSPRAMDIRDQLTEEARNGDAPVATRARVVAAAGDPSRAWRLIKTLANKELASDTPDVNVLLAVAEIRLLLAQNASAAEIFTRVLTLQPDSTDAALGLSEAFAKQGMVPESRKWLEFAAKSDPDDIRALEKLAALDAGSAKEGSHWIEAGRRSTRGLQVLRARRLIERAEATGPESMAGAALALGSLEERLGRPVQALTAYQRAAASGERTAEVLTHIGRNQRKLGKLVEAQNTLEEAMVLNPAAPEPAEELGAVHLSAGRSEEALVLLSKAREGVSVHTAASNFTLAAALRATGDFDEAVRLLSGELAPASHHRLAAQIFKDQGDLDSASARMATAIALDPDDPDSRVELATLLESMGDSAGAREQQAWASHFQAHTPDEAGEVAITTQRSLLSLDDLVVSFAKKIPKAEQRRMTLLSIEEPSDPKTLLIRAGRPRAPDIGLLRQGIEAAIDARFVHVRVPPEDIDALTHPISQLRDFEGENALDANVVATVNAVLGIDGVFLTRIIAHDEKTRDTCGPDAFGVEMRLLTGRDAEVVTLLSNFDCLDGGLEAYGRWNLTGLGIYAFVGLLLLWPIVRGWGAVQVEIRLPDKTKGFFSIHINDGPDMVIRERVDKISNREKTKSMRRFDLLRRFERHMAGSDTKFKWIPARRAGPYYVTVAGPLLDAMGEEIIGHFLEEQTVLVRRSGLSTLTFDFRPKECAIEVKILSEEKPAAQARVALLGDPGSLRYARDGSAFLYLGLGQYTLLLGSHDSAAEYPLEVHSLASAIPVHIDLADSTCTVFTDCADAVEPFLQSDFTRAADALEANGKEDVAHRLRADHLRQQGRNDEAAVELQAAGDLQSAAQIRAEGSDFTGSAALFEEAGDHEQAAQAYRDAGEWAEAGRCYEVTYDYGNALECWRECNDRERELDILEKLGESMDAAALALDLGDSERAIQNLQQVDSRHPYFTDACRMIAEIASEGGDHDLAILKIEEGIGTVGAASTSVETLETYAQILERAGKHREALTAYETIRRRDVARTDVATRIQELKSQIDQADTSRTQAVKASPSESRYELLEEIGRGGMGVVYKARDKRLGRIVALKRLPENMSEHPTAIELFDREARAAAALNHVNIVTLFDAGEEDGAYFITMELLEGRPLNAILDHNGRISPADTSRLGIQICAGLQYAHQNAIVHRDIKTANLFFTTDQTVKIMDFGIAKSMQEVRRATTVIGGTPYYMAPEQAAGEGVDHRADLYALGVTLFQLMTGSLPFSDGDVTYRHRHETPPDPREINLEIPAELAKLVLELMEKNPESRPDSASSVATRLAEITRG